MSDDFNYDGNYPGDDEEEIQESSSPDFSDLIQRLQQEDSAEESQETEDGTGSSDSSSQTQQKRTGDKPSKTKSDQPSGRYGDGPPSQKVKPESQLNKNTSQVSKGSGDDNLFSKITNKFKGGKGEGGKELGKTLGKEAAKKGGKEAAKKKAQQKAGQKVMQLLAKVPWQVWVVIAIVIVVIFLIMVLALVASAIMAWVQSSSSPNANVTSEYFYGLRTAYIDDTELNNALQLSYKEYVVDILTDITTEDPSLTISITLPEQCFNNATGVDQHITNMSVGIGYVVANDLTSASSVSYDVEFSTLYPSIPYFGLTTTQSDVVEDFLIDYIESNNLIDSDNISTLVTTATDKLTYINNICEKVIIKDEMANEDGIHTLETRNYIGSVYMPHSDIIIDSSIYLIINENEDFATDTKFIEQNNGHEIIHKEKQTADQNDYIIGLVAGEIKLNKFTSIDSENQSAFTSGLSIFDALRLSQTYASYFTQNEEGVYTWKPNDESLLYYTYSSNTPFMFTDFWLSVKLAGN